MPPMSSAAPPPASTAADRHAGGPAGEHFLAGRRRDRPCQVRPVLRDAGELASSPAGGADALGEGRRLGLLGLAT